MLLVLCCRCSIATQCFTLEAARCSCLGCLALVHVSLYISTFDTCLQCGLQHSFSCCHCCTMHKICSCCHAMALYAALQLLHGMFAKCGRLHWPWDLQCSACTLSSRRLVHYSAYFSFTVPVRAVHMPSHESWWPRLDCLAWHAQHHADRLQTHMG